MGLFDFLKKKKKSTPKVYQGPTRPTTNIQTFRRTGYSYGSSKLDNFSKIIKKQKEETKNLFKRKSSGSSGGGSRSIQTTSSQSPILEAKARQERELKTIAPNIKSSSKDIQQQRIKPKEVLDKTKSPYISEIQPLQNSNSLEEKIARKKDEFRTKQLRGGSSYFNRVEQFGLGVGSSVYSALSFGWNLGRHPVQTISQSVIGGGKVISGFFKGTTYPSIGKTLMINPSFAAGYMTGEALSFYGASKIPKGIQVGSDVIRTRGLKEIKATEVIDPKYFEGQTFPKINKGQTAGQLKEEFKPLLPGEVKPAGFTASPKPFPKETKTLRGNSELPGTYQSPKLSPHFLRVSGESETKFFGGKIFDTWRPTAMRITPESFELTPEVKLNQKNLADLGKTKSFFEKAPKGKSYISFIKTEKEAIIPFETPLRETGKNVFFKFEGRRIPIKEFETIPVTDIKKVKIESSSFVKQKTIKQYSEMYPSRKIKGSNSIVNPLTSSIAVSSVYKPKYSKLIPSFSFIISNSKNYYKTKRGLESPKLFGSRKILSSPKITYKVSSLYSQKIIGPPSYLGGGISSPPKRVKKNLKIPKNQETIKIKKLFHNPFSRSFEGFSTSFTGFVRGITKAPKLGKLGKTGFEIRPLSKKGKVIFKYKTKKVKRRKK